MPVFMNVWAGSWLIASVCIERMMHMSSASLPMLGKSVQISCCDLPYFANGCCGAKQFKLLPLQLRDRLALGDRLGHRLAVQFGQLGLVVERFQVRRPAGHVEIDDPLAARREMQRMNDAASTFGCSRQPGRRSSAAAASSSGFSSDASASEPMPAAVRPKKVRRVSCKRTVQIVHGYRSIAICRRAWHRPR